jgi:type I restriction enzyme R subunit
MASKKGLTEQEIRTRYILPAIQKAGWRPHQIGEERACFTDGTIQVKGDRATRDKKTLKRVDYILYYKPNMPIAIIEAKNNRLTLSSGIQQALDYAKLLDVSFVYSSNGDGFYEHDRTLSNGTIEQELKLDAFPSPDELWQRYKTYKGIVTSEQEKIVTQDYFSDRSGRKPRYYQQNAINRTVEAVVKGQNRILLVMATGTGKTYTAFQIIHRLWRSGAKKRILFLADRNALIDQTVKGDFRYFKDKKTVIRKKRIDKSFEIYLALYQGLTNYDEDSDAYREFSPNFFDLVIIDEAHRGSASADSAWRVILDYFANATHIGLTATPKETKEVSNREYFGEPIYTYSLKQGIEDGFLAPYKVLRIGLNIDLEGWKPEQGKTDIYGNEVEDREYNRKDYDKNLVILDRSDIVAKKITEYLKQHDRFAKTIVFCVDIEHANRMRNALAKENSDLMAVDSRYVMQITGDNREGKQELDNFINPAETYPVIATTSKLMTTGVDAQTCKLIVLDSEINSQTEFKQIIGRGTRINEEYGKRFFTIMDFREVTKHFADKDFDGEPIQIKEFKEEDEFSSKEGVESLENSDTQANLVKERDKLEYGKKREKIIVNGVNVTVLNERIQLINAEGKLIMVSLKEYTKTKVQEEYGSLDDFLNQWNSFDKKEAIIAELEEKGIIVEDFKQEIGKNMDIFDMICHCAFDVPPLTRKERANRVIKRNYFTKYKAKAQEVLKALLNKYADEGIENIESMRVLKLSDFKEFGSPREIVKLFGGKKDYINAVIELEQELYKVA